MSDGNVAKPLGDLGKRIERLFYFGSLLFLFGCLNLYFVNVANYVERENPDDINYLISSVGKKLEELNEKFNNPPKKVDKNKNIIENERTSQVRKQLGLPPREEKTEPTTTSKIQTYQDLLTNIINDIKYKSKLSKESLAIVQDASKSPQEIMLSLEARREQIAKRPVMIWGVESPLILPFQYGGARYQIPASFIAKSLSLALLPLILGWLGSLYLTRHRELLLIRRIRWHGHTFPHILNIFSVGDEITESKFHLKNKRKNRFEIWFEKFLPSALRSIVIMVFCIPISLILGYSFAQLFLFGDGISIWVYITFFIFIVWFFIQIFLLLFQEWAMLWDKHYYA